MSLVQYVILRKDLQTVLNWPLGALFGKIFNCFDNWLIKMSIFSGRLIHLSV